MKIYGVIMAGGEGTRFWPLSRKSTPKQLLNLSGKDLMVNEAIDRLIPMVDQENIFIVTNAAQTKKMKEAVTGRILENHILSEPAARNTAACIGYAAFEILKKYGDGIMVITPSDASIRDVDALTEALRAAVRAAEEEDKLVSVGINPTFPATGYGYIKFDKTDQHTAKKVLEFREKPDYPTARAYLASGSYAWNSGMFIWKASTIMKEYENLLPDIYGNLIRIGDSMGTDRELECLTEVYPAIRNISIDYGIMERSRDVLVIPGDFGWNDVGSWDMLDVLHEKDPDGNVIIGDQINIDTKNCVSYSSGKLIATLGVEDLIIVETEDAILVCGRNRAQDVKLIVKDLNEQGRKELL